MKYIVLIIMLALISCQSKSSYPHSVDIFDCFIDECLKIGFDKYTYSYNEPLLGSLMKGYFKEQDAVLRNYYELSISGKYTTRLYLHSFIYDTTNAPDSSIRALVRTYLHMQIGKQHVKWAAYMRNLPPHYRGYVDGIKKNDFLLIYLIEYPVQDSLFVKELINSINMSMKLTGCEHMPDVVAKLKDM